MATEGEAVTEQQPAAEEPEKVVTEKKAKAAKEKKPKAPKEKKPKQSKTLSHPPYFQVFFVNLIKLNYKSRSLKEVFDIIVINCACADDNGGTDGAAR